LYQGLMMTDCPTASCCSEVDAHWCDSILVNDGKNFCTISHDRDNIRLKRTPVPIGAEIEIPDNKLTRKDGNPTGHGVAFLNTDGFVHCFGMNGENDHCLAPAADGRGLLLLGFTKTLRICRC
jgi:hypothetical protein